MRRSLALFVAAVAVAGCGGKPAASGVAAGCAGLHTAPHTTRFLTLFGATKLLTPAFVCAHFGAPQKITQDSDGRVSWHYGSVMLTFKGNRVIKEARTQGNSTYSITESLVQVGSSGSPGQSQSQAEARARALAQTIAAQQQKVCREKQVRVASVSCRPAAKGWSCDYSLSDGSGGLIKEPAPRGNSELSIAC